MILNNTAVTVSAGNAVTTNPDGTANVTGTVIGVGQTAQSLVSLGTMTIESKAIAVVHVFRPCISQYFKNLLEEGVNLATMIIDKYKTILVPSMGGL